ncbi:hypothetical protein GCM10022254_54510 [Actinomadura meridiana]|uniref:indole-3-glycerol-phosphate synthase n=1 Tax=Actinomadura meridiana TaxID=559626 RepID=A0ABP8CEZ4_9ACTN
MTSRFIEALLAAETPVIMEIKARDAAGTDLTDGRSPADLASAYETAGAPCLSVVTGRWFGGDRDMLRAVAARTDLPILQKDFITSDADLERARDLGASAVLLTAALLSAGTLASRIDRCLAVGLTPFVEVVSEGEIQTVTHVADCVIAVNNKDIRDRETGAADIGRSLSLLPAVRATGTRCPVSASGITTPEIAATLLDAGYAGLLIGTGLLRAPSLTTWRDALAEGRR